MKITLTTAEDLANIVVKAIEYEGEWPIRGGIKGCEMGLMEVIRLGEEVRGKSPIYLNLPRSIVCHLGPDLADPRLTLAGGSFTVERLKLDDLKAGVIKSSWMPRPDHPAIPADQREILGGILLAGFSLGIAAGALNVSDEWNRIFPKYRFTQPKEFLGEAWRGKA